MSSNDPTPMRGTRALDPPLAIKPVVLTERRSKFRLHLHAILDIGKIACLIAAAHLLIRLTITLPAVLIETQKLTYELRGIRDEVSHILNRQH